jgi:hypothetical protein
MSIFCKIMKYTVFDISTYFCAGLFGTGISLVNTNVVLLSNANYGFVTQEATQKIKKSNLSYKENLKFIVEGLLCGSLIGLFYPVTIPICANAFLLNKIKSTK